MNYGKEMLKQFDGLPERCKELIFEEINKRLVSLDFEEIGKICNELIETQELLDYCESPIEELFYIAFAIFRTSQTIFCDIDPQHEVECGEKDYRADFCISFSECWGSQRFKPINDIMLLIECDGHEFHEKTKEQVAHDNERDLALKTAGYDVLHFSGSQIYKDPMGCVEKAVNYYKKITIGVEKKYEISNI